MEAKSQGYGVSGLLFFSGDKHPVIDNNPNGLEAGGAAPRVAVHLDP